MYYVIQGNANGNLTVTGKSVASFDEAIDVAKKALLSSNQLKVTVVKEVGVVEREVAVKITKSE